MMSIEDTRDYRKLDPNVKRAVDESIEKLRHRYSQYKKQNKVIASVFGDDVIVHDIVNKEFYVYKTQANRMQVRLLYKITTDNKLDVISFYIKNSNSVVSMNGSKRQTRYLNLFEACAKEYKRKELYLS